MEIEHAIELFRTKRFTENSEKNIDVDGNNIQEMQKKGRTLLLCSCENGTKFCNESPLCRHKQFFILLPLLKRVNSRVEDLVEYYNQMKNISYEKEKKAYGIFIDDLGKVGRFE